MKALVQFLRSIFEWVKWLGSQAGTFLRWLYSGPGFVVSVVLAVQAFIVRSLENAVQSLYDAASAFQSLQGGVSGGSSLGGMGLQLLSLANSFIPLDLMFSLLLLYMQAWAAFAVYRFIKSLIPSWGGT